MERKLIPGVILGLKESFFFRPIFVGTFGERRRERKKIFQCFELEMFFWDELILDSLRRRQQRYHRRRHRRCRRHHRCRRRLRRRHRF